jgi:glycerol-3-phosphate dehydrogenase
MKKSLMIPPVFDLAIIGGGVNGCGIARDAAGRGLSVFLCERDDLASGTSSASTKLIHGGLRYLEYYEFRLVREALQEREVLLRAAPHIIWPLRFILPHHKGLRPAWLIRLGLFLYDHLGGRELLPGTTTINLTTDPAGRVLKPLFTKGFEYSDCWVIDSRLVILNAMDAARKGAEVHARTPCLGAYRKGDLWQVTIFDQASGKQRTIQARTLVNASGPWMDRTLATIEHGAAREHIRMVKGSHIIIHRLYDHERAYLFQNADGRIIFAIPYAGDFTLIGTTDVDFHGDPAEVAITQAEVDYLCAAASEYFIRPITPASVVSSYAGIRPLFDDGKSDAKAATRDYVLTLDSTNGKAPLLAIYGGKITTYRKLAESVLAKLAPFLPGMGGPWTVNSHLPGGAFPPDQFDVEAARLASACPILTQKHARRLLRNYGTLAFEMVGHIKNAADAGILFGADLYQFEVEYLIRFEWAKTAEDILRRRTSMGLILDPSEQAHLHNWVCSHDASIRQGEVDAA